MGCKQRLRDAVDDRIDLSLSLSRSNGTFLTVLSGVKPVARLPG
jgi:hypothetical protein